MSSIYLHVSRHFQGAVKSFLVVCPLRDQLANKLIAHVIVTPQLKRWRLHSVLKKNKTLSISRVHLYVEPIHFCHHVLSALQKGKHWHPVARCNVNSELHVLLRKGKCELYVSFFMIVMDSKLLICVINWDSQSKFLFI